jgi:hypothetical protein
MELTYNWRGLQRLFNPKSRSPQVPSAKAVSPIYLITQRGIVIAGFAEEEDFSEWLGAPFEEVMQQFRHRDCINFERDQVDAWLNDASEQPHFIEQIQTIRKKALEVAPSRRLKQDLTDLFSREHFLLQAFRGWWSRVLPGEFGFFLRLTGAYNQEPQDFLLILRNGTLLGFVEPELASMGKDRVGNAGEVAKYLSEKHLVPIVAMVAPLADWQSWHQSRDPWREVARGVRSQAVRLEPSQWNMKALLMARAYLGL